MDRKPTNEQYLTFNTVPERLPGLQLKHTTKTAVTSSLID